MAISYKKLFHMMSGVDDILEFIPEEDLEKGNSHKRKR